MSHIVRPSAQRVAYLLPYSNKDDINTLMYNSYIVQFLHIITYVQNNAVHIYQVKITVCIAIQFLTLFIVNLV